MRQRIFSYIITATLTIAVLYHTANALFADYQTATVALTAGWVEMQLSESEGDILSPEMNINVTNKGSLNADLWLENIYCQQNDTTEIDELSEISADGITRGVMVEVIYNNVLTSFSIDDPDHHGTPMLLLKDMKPGSDAFVTIRQTTSLQPDINLESSGEDSLSDSAYEQLSVPVPYIFEFILKSGTFSSLAGDSILTMTKTYDIYRQSTESDEQVEAFEETPKTRTAGETADPYAPPGEAQPLDSAESAAVTAIPEETPEAAPQSDQPQETAATPSMPDLSEFAG